MRPHPPSGVSEFLLAHFAESFPGAERLFRLHQDLFSHLESAPPPLSPARRRRPLTRHSKPNLMQIYMARSDQKNGPYTLEEVNAQVIRKA